MKKSLFLFFLIINFSSCVVKEKSILPEMTLLRSILNGVVSRISNVFCDLNPSSCKFVLSANVTGLLNGTLVLTNNLNDDLSFSTNEKKDFFIQVAQNTNYSVTVKTSVDGNNCVITNPSGTMPANNLTLEVTCSPQAMVYGGQFWTTNPFSIPEINTEVLRLSTISGSTIGFSDSPSPQFSQPTGFTTDGLNLYIGDTNNRLIRKLVIATNQVSTIAGTPSVIDSVDGVGSSAKFNDPRYLTTDGKFLYILDRLNHNVRRLDLSNNEVITIAGPSNCGGPCSSGNTNGVGSSARFNEPTAITLVNGNLYIYDGLNFKIRKLNLNTNEVTDFAGSGINASSDGIGAAANLDYSKAMTSNLTDLFLAETASQKIRKINLATAEVTSIGGRNYSALTKDGANGISGFYEPEGLVLDKSNLYVLQSNGFLRKIILNENFTSTIFRGFAPTGNLDGESEIGRFCGSSNCAGMATDGRRFFFIDRGNHTIRKFEENLILRFSFDETPSNGGVAIDSGLNNLTASIGSNITSITDRDGSSNKAFYFGGGSSSRVTVDDNAIFNSFTNEISISFWINPSSHNDATILQKYSSANADGFYVQYFNSSPNHAVLQFCQGLSGTLVCTETIQKNILHLNVWQHIAITKSASNVVSIFFNGSSLAVNSSGAHNSILLNSQKLLISGTTNFIGGLDDIRFYNIELSVREIARISIDIHKGLASHFGSNNYTNSGPILNGNHFDNSSASSNLTAIENRFKIPSSAFNSWVAQEANFPANSFEQFPEANEDFTACVWTRNLGLNDLVYRSIFVFGTSANGQSIEIGQRGLTAATDRFTFSAFSAPFETHFDFKALDDRWHFFCATHEESTNQIRMYLDGNLVQTSTIPALNVQKQTLIIGRGYGGSNDFRGDIDDLRIYTRRLLDNEILALTKFGNRRIFISNQAYDGGMGGIVNISTHCKNDINNPYGATNREWKFLGTDDTNRRACLNSSCAFSENYNWSLSPLTTYIRGIDMTSVFTTNSTGIFSFPLLNPIDLSSQTIWTGLKSDWTNNPDNCSNWNGTGGFASIGQSNSLNSTLIENGASACTANLKLICVEQY